SVCPLHRIPNTTFSLQRENSLRVQRFQNPAFAEYPASSAGYGALTLGSVERVCVPRWAKHPANYGAWLQWHKLCIGRTGNFTNEGYHARYSRRYSLQWPALLGEGRYNQ